MMHKIPFFIGTFISYFIPGRDRRHRVRGHINLFFFYIPIAIFIRRVYGERVKSIRFVRQISMKRMTCVVNNKYYVKVFRFVSVRRLNEYKLLLDFIRAKLPVDIPRIFVAKHIPMYVAKKLPGKELSKFNKKQIIQNQRKIRAQVFAIIKALSTIPIDSIPDKERFASRIQARKVENVIGPNSVLAHCDLNAGNILLNKDLNVTGIIDWDSLAIVPNPNKDREYFEHLWKKFINGGGHD